MFTYTSKNVLLVVGIMSSVFLGLGECLEVFECPAAVISDKLRTSLYVTSGQFLNFDGN